MVNEALTLVRGALFAALCGVAMVLGADTALEAPMPEDDGAIPLPLKSDDFEGLMANSPFTRSLGVSDSLILTGVARYGKEVFATVLDTQTRQSQVVSQTPNGEGWRLVSVGGDPGKKQTWSATIQVRGGETIHVRYQEPPPRPARGTSMAGGGSSGGPGGGPPPLSSSQVEESKRAAVNYREGFDADGYPREPPPEMVEKLSRLSVGQREEINRQMFGLRNRGLGMEDRRRIYEDTVNRAMQGRR